MAQLIADRRDIDFVLYEQLNADQICKHPKFSELNRKAFDMLINEARNIAVKEILPTYSEGDREGVKFENGTVKVPECFRKVFKLFKQGEWMAIATYFGAGCFGISGRRKLRILYLHDFSQRFRQDD